jgi:hypothetical protein
LTNAGGEDIFIVEYDASGNMLWAKSAGGSSDDGGQGIDTDGSGNVFVTGYFVSSTIAFGTTTLTSTPTTSFDDDIFIVKYDASGNVLWAKSAAGFGDDDGIGISTDASGNVFVTGYSDSYIITFGTITYTNVGYRCPFIVKYDASGNVLWAKSAAGSTYDGGVGISTDLSGNVFITGYFASGSITFGTTSLTNKGGSDIFIVKYDASGNVIWAKSAGGSGFDRGVGISTDASSNVFVTGYFSDYTGTFGTTTLNNAGNPDIFIVKYDASGNVIWAKSAGGLGDDAGLAISTDASGNVFVTGYFYSSAIVFDNITLTNSSGYPDIFIVKLASSSTTTSSSTTNVTGGNNNNSMSANVYPNPFFSSATLKIEMLNPAKATVALADVTGKVVHYFGQGINLNAGENTFNYPENLSPGVYEVKVFTEDAVKILKCVKVQ